MARKKGGGDMTEWLFGIVLAVFFLSALLGTIAERLNALEADTTNFSASEIALISIMVIVVIIAAVRKIAKTSGL